MSAASYPAALVKAAKALLDCRDALERTRGAPKKSRTATKTPKSTTRPKASRGTGRSRTKTAKLKTTTRPRASRGTGRSRKKVTELGPRASWGSRKQRTKIARRKTTPPTPIQPTQKLVEAVASAVVSAMVPAPRNKRKSSVPKRRTYASSLPAPMQARAKAHDISARLARARAMVRATPRGSVQSRMLVGMIARMTSRTNAREPARPMPQLVSAPKNKRESPASSQARAKARDLLAHLARATPRGSVGRASTKSRLASAIRKRSAKIGRQRRTLNDRETKFAQRLIDVYAKNDAIVDVQTVEKEASLIRRHYAGLLPTPFLRKSWRDVVVRGATRQPGSRNKSIYDQWMSLGAKQYPTKNKVHVMRYDPRLDRDHPDYDPTIKPKFHRTLVNESVRRFRKQLTGSEDVLPLKRTGR
jgi:hypothetical protein